MEEQKPIGGGLAFALITTALLIDGLQALLTFLIVGIVLNPILNILVGLTFSIMLYHHGGGLIRRRAISMAITTIGEFLPFVGALPLWTAFAIYTIAVDKIQTRFQQQLTEVKAPCGRTWRL